MNKSKPTTWKQLSMKQVKILYTNTGLVTDWEKSFILSLKNNNFKVSSKQMSIVEKILGKIGYKNSEEYYKKQISKNKHYNFDTWTKIENSK